MKVQNVLSCFACEKGPREACPTHPGAQSHREDRQRIGKGDLAFRPGGLVEGAWG